MSIFGFKPNSYKPKYYYPLMNDLTRIKEQLQSIAAVLRKPETDYYELKNALTVYEEIVLRLAGVDYAQEDNRTDIHCENGKALGTTWAAMCIQDLVRTKVFVKGLFEAVEDVRRKKPGAVHVLYAGTGPFATLALPLMATLAPQQVKFTLLEINKQSFDCAKRVVETLGYGDHVVQMLCADATTVALPDAHSYDILLSETMQHALKKEQQVPIVLHLLGQLREDAILIPQCIQLDAALLDIKDATIDLPSFSEENCKRLGSFFQLNRENLPALAQHTLHNGAIHYDKHTYKIPADALKEFNTVAVLTEIQVYKENRIHLNASGLTIPYILTMATASDDDAVLDINYMVSEEPGIVFELKKQTIAL